MGKPFSSDNDIRPFPIQAGNSYRDTTGAMIRDKPCAIPWWIAEEAYTWYVERFGNRQTLQRLAERGGFGRKELLWLLRRNKDI